MHQSNVPQLRFKEFKDDYNVYNFFDMRDKKVKWSLTGGPFGSDLKSKHYTEKGVRVIVLQNIGDGNFINDYKIFTTVKKADSLKSCNIYKNEILISKMGDPVARACILPSLDERYLMGSDGIRFVPCKIKFDKMYIFQTINHFSFRKQAIRLSTGSTRRRIGLIELKKIISKIPKVNEQKKVASFLTAVDSKIEKLTRKKELLEEYKKGVMQKLFSGEIRFKDEDGNDYPDWEERNLGDIGKVVSCRRIYANETHSEGDIPFYKIGTFGKVANAYISKYIYTDYKNRYDFPKTGNILISASGTLGRLVVYNGEDAYFQDSNIIWIENDESMVLDKFLYFVLQIVKFNSEGGTIQRLYNSIVKKTSFQMPSIQEQLKIALFLSLINSKIENSSQQIKNTKEFKKGLLQQMFV